MLKQVLRSAGAQAVLARLAGIYLRLALRSTRWTLHGAEHLAPAASGQAPFIVAFWHERLPLLPALLLHARRMPGTMPPLAVLVSRHADGRLIGRLMRQFDLRVVHGSTARGGKDRGGAAGLRQLLQQLQLGAHVVLTPDGPRGPRRVAASGVAQLAALAGVAVLPVAAQTSRRRTLGSWDGMVLPLPLGRGVLVCLPALSVPRDDIEVGLAAIAASLTAAIETADRLCAQAIVRPGARLMAALYAGAATALAPLLRRRLRRRVARGKEIAARLPERWGIETQPRPPGRLIWLHAASVGETVSLLPVLSELQSRGVNRILLTTGSVTSARLLAERLPMLGLTQTVLHCFVPLDVPGWVGGFLDHWRPDVAGFVESEIWPNLLAAVRARGLPLMLINARLSPRSFRQWSRLGSFATMQFAGFALIQAQSQADAERLQALGARTVSVPGNLKLAAAPLPADAAELARLAALLAGRPVWLAASTHKGEEAVALSVHDALIAKHPNLLTIIAPRHPERGAAIAAMAADRGVSRRALGQDPAPVWIADTLGEFGLLYRLAGPVFVGGSLVPHGGQNVLEPARLGCPIAVGPKTENFADAVTVLERAGGLAVVADGPALAAWVATLFADPDRCRAMGQAAAAAADPRPELPGIVADALLSLLP